MALRPGGRDQNWKAAGLCALSRLGKSGRSGAACGDARRKWRPGATKKL
ncbi:hypothetical protein L810_0047 [Burkholderia sp. AU4i]|nr:hypothetical protein L810_0047 [Burkholderia sp. AU4i]MDW9228004.1 hypothetical protein [Burkholderia cepacia]QOH31815.1 hypothetical protein C7S14_5139 [Burkholderia cepacia]